MLELNPVLKQMRSLKKSLIKNGIKNVALKERLHPDKLLILDRK